MTPQPFNPYREMFAIEGATIFVDDPRQPGKQKYASIVLNEDKTVEVNKMVGSPSYPSVDQKINEFAIGLEKFGKRSKLTDPAQIVHAFVSGLAQSKNRQKFPKRGDKTQ